MTASTLDRQVQFYRARLTDNGLEMAETWETYGGLTWALRQDVKDAEKAMAGTIMATITSRFLVRSSEFT
jgi:head-tail adaptor